MKEVLNDEKTKGIYSKIMFRKSDRRNHQMKSNNAGTFKYSASWLFDNLQENFKETDS